MRMRFSPPWKKLAQPVGQERGTIVFWRMRLRNPAEQRFALLLTLAAPQISALVGRTLLALRASRGGTEVSQQAGRKQSNRFA